MLYLQIQEAEEKQKDDAKTSVRQNGTVSPIKEEDDQSLKDADSIKNTSDSKVGRTICCLNLSNR